MLGLARGFMILKQTPKAKFQLKRILNHPWTLEDADYLEQCLLFILKLLLLLLVASRLVKKCRFTEGGIAI